MEEFKEQDVWGALEPSASIKIQKSNKPAEILSSSSAPAYVLNWSKLWKEAPEKKKWRDESDKEDNACNGEGDDKGGWLPPHEILDRRMRRRNRAAYSMCEGKGRTLKGRDLIKVRNAVLKKTGFLE